MNLVRPLAHGRRRRARPQRATRTRSLRDGMLLSALVIVVADPHRSCRCTRCRSPARARWPTCATHIFLFFQRLQLRYFDRTPVGRLVTRATNDVDAVGELFASGALNAIGDLLSLVGIVVMMLALDWRLSLIAFAALPVVGLIVNFVRKRSREAYRDIRAKTARLNAFLNEQVSGIAVVQAYAREAQMAARVRRHQRRLPRREQALDLLRGDPRRRDRDGEHALHREHPLVGRLRSGSATTRSRSRSSSRSRSTSSSSSSRSACSRSATRSSRARWRAPSASSSSSTRRRSRSRPPPEAEARRRGPADEAIALEHVTFEYKPGVPVLRDVTLHVPSAASSIALVGATGAGKTTVASLLLRLYEAAERRGARARQGRAELRPPRAPRALLGRPAGRVPVPGTVLSNVAMSDDAPDRERAEKALARIGALELFERCEATARAPGSTRASTSAARTSAPASASSSPSRAPSTATRRSSPRRGHRQRRLRHRGAPAARARGGDGTGARRSSSRTASRRSARSTASSSSTRAASSRQGSHDELIAKEGVYARLYRMQFAHEQARREARAATLAPASGSR